MVSNFIVIQKVFKKTRAKKLFFFCFSEISHFADLSFAKKPICLTEKALPRNG
jgi:hypothetical protein